MLVVSRPTGLPSKKADENAWKHSVERSSHLQQAERRAVIFFVGTTTVVGLGALFLTNEGRAYLVNAGLLSPSQDDASVTLKDEVQTTNDPREHP